MLRRYWVSESVCRQSYKYIRFGRPYCYFRLSVVVAVIQGHFLWTRGRPNRTSYSCRCKRPHYLMTLTFDLEWPWMSLVIVTVDSPWSVSCVTSVDSNHFYVNMWRLFHPQAQHVCVKQKRNTRVKFVMPVTHVQETCIKNLMQVSCTRNLYKFLVQVSCTSVTDIILNVYRLVPIAAVGTSVCFFAFSIAAMSIDSNRVLMFYVGRISVISLLMYSFIFTLLLIVYGCRHATWWLILSTVCH